MYRFRKKFECVLNLKQKKNTHTQYLLNVYKNFGRCVLSMFIHHDETEAKERIALEIIK